LSDGDDEEQAGGEEIGFCKHNGIFIGFEDYKDQIRNCGPVMQ
jgi:hypothetical protein